MNRTLSFIFLGLGCLVMAVCSPAGQAVDSTAAAASSAHDFKAMLTRTDEVEVCVNHFINKVPACAEAAVSCVHTLMRPACQCQSDYMRHALREAGANPALENATIQMAMNMEVGEIIWPEEDLVEVWEEFGPFLTAYAAEHFGEDSEQKLKIAASAIRDATEADRPVLMLELPSCAHAETVWGRTIADPDKQDQLYLFFLNEFPTSKASAKRNSAADAS